MVTFSSNVFITKRNPDARIHGAKIIFSYIYSKNDPVLSVKTPYMELLGLG